MRQIAICLLVLACVVPTQALGQYIGLYTTPNPVLPVEPDPPPPVLRSMTLPLMTPTPVYIVAHVTGSQELQVGLTGAEFAITGLPPLSDLVVTQLQPNAQAFVSLGEPFSVGAQIEFPLCQAPSANQAVMLYSAMFVALNPVGDVTVSLGPPQFPTHPTFPLPYLMFCDSLLPLPIVEAKPVPIVINPSVSVQSRAWTAIKMQYDQEGTSRQP